MRRFALIVATWLAWPLAGCVSVPPQAQGLTAVTRSDTLVIKEGTYYDEVRGLLKIHWRYTLLPGVYRAEKENASGVFYRGTDRAVVLERLDENGHTKSPGAIYRTGGVWIPKDNPKDLRVYNDVEATEHLGPGITENGQPTATVHVTAPPRASIAQTGLGAGIGASVVGAAIQADVGKIVLWDPPGATFADRVLQGLQ